MTAIALALLAAVFWGTADFLGGSQSRSKSPALVIACGQLAGLVSVGALAALTTSPHFSIAAQLPALSAGLLGCIGITSLYRALAIGPMGVVAPIVAASAIVPVIVGLLRGEAPAAWQLAGMGLALSGVLVLSADNHATGTGAVARITVILALVTMLALGLELVLIGSASRHLGAAWAITVARVLVATYGLAMLVRERTPAPSLRIAAPLAGIGLVDTAAFTCFAYATQHGLLSIVSVLGSLFPVVTIALAASVHHERLARHQSLGASIALIGVALVSMH